MNEFVQYLYILLIISLVFSIGFLAYCIKNRGKRGATSLVVVFTGLVIWLVSEFIQTHTGADPFAYGGILFRFIGTDLTVLGAFLFGLEYTGRDKLLNRKTIALLAIKPVLMIAVTLSPYRDWLFGVNTDVNSETFPWGYEFIQAELFIVHVLYSYTLLLVAVGMAAFAMGRATHAYGRQIFSLILALSVPLALNILFNAEMIPFDLTPSGFLVTACVFMYATFQLELMDTMPVARRTVLEKMDDMVFLLDETGRIETFNESARTTFPDRKLHGEHITTVLGEDVPVASHETVTENESTTNPEISESPTAATQTDITTTINGELRHLTLNRTAFTDHHGELLGQLFVCSDITERKRYEQKLEEQNDRLDRFASMISHDLRNPLHVAQARTDLAETTEDKEHFEALREAHERMEAMIEDMLALARAKTAVEETESVTLPTLAEKAWETSQTGDATLEISSPWQETVECNPELLQNVFENLFRNAVEHNQGPLTVEVGLLEEDEGFYIEDTGSGIPPEERSEVFEYGYSSEHEGTGLGLAIVADLVAAHDWEITITEGEAGGARFEIRTDPERNVVESL